MANPENTEHAWNLVINSPYLLIANPFYNNLPNPGNNFGHDFNGAGHSLVNAGENLSNLNVESGPGAGHADGAGNSGAVWEVLGSFEHHTISENPILIDNPAGGNVDPALVLPENNPPIAPVTDAENGFNHTMLKMDPVTDAGNSGAVWEVLGSFEHHTISENPILIDNPAGGNVDPALVLPENNPPIAPVTDAENGFNPDDRRFVIQFFAKRLISEPLEEGHRIHEINFYDFPPQHIADIYSHGVPNVLFLFTPVRRRSNGQAVRSIPGERGGKWSRVGGFVQHIKSNGDVVFNIKSYKFVPKNPSPNDVSWLMKEFSLSNEEIQPHSINIHECVAVKLYQK